MWVFFLYFLVHHQQIHKIQKKNLKILSQGRGHEKFETFGLWDHIWDPPKGQKLKKLKRRKKKKKENNKKRKKGRKKGK